ncbi:MAG TPA: ATP-binding cassette domain-containing protein [Usitatibacter sp.]|nr:ATP-binding cassette domain-containing protein [Usitatibacter sp.]
MNGRDPGLPLHSTTLEAALGLLASSLGVQFAPLETLPDEAADAFEALALPAGLRSRRVILDRGWWHEAAGPMVARVAERRRVARGPAPTPNPSLAAGTGWVALVPHGGGYRMRALGEDGTAVEWRVDRDVAARLSPYAFTFHRRFGRVAMRSQELLRFALREGTADLARLLLAAAAAGLLGLLTPFATAHLIDRAIPAAQPQAILAIVAGLAVAGVAALLLDVLRTLAMLRFEARSGVAMQAAIVDRVVSAPASFFRAFSSGDLALRMGSVGTVQRTLTDSALGAFVTGAFLAGNAAMMLAYSPRLTAGALAVVALAVAISIVLGLARLRIGPRIEALDGRLAALTFELFSGIAKLRAGAAEARAFERWSRRYAEFRDADMAGARIANRETVAMSLVAPLATALVLALAWGLSGGAAALTAGAFVAFHTALFGALAAVHALASDAMGLVALKPVWDRARPILDALPEDSAQGALRHAPRGAIALEGVRFAYPGGSEVLHGIDLAIREGELVAIVGASGSGKSTLLRLLLGFERPRSGTVRYDGKDLATLDVPWLRRRMGTVLQNGRLWPGDLYTNIAGASNASLDEAWDAACRAGLGPEIEAMPMGMYTVVGEGLSTLSGGQRQRVLLARALVRSPRIVLLDEATSALDNESQAAVLATIGALRATRIVIAHRLDTVRGADRIVVLEEGRIVQQGTFRELAAREGAFAALVARQVA